MPATGSHDILRRIGYKAIQATSVLTGPSGDRSSSSLEGFPLLGAARDALMSRISRNKIAMTGTSPTLNVALKNSTASGNVYAYITGLDFNRDARGPRPFILQADGRSGYWPNSPSAILQPLEKNCAIFLGHPGNTVTVTIPHISGGRIWFSVGKPLTFLLNPGPNGAAAVVEPSATNPSDPNYLASWSFAEFTYNMYELFVNVSYVDFVSLPISLKVTGQHSGTREVPALPPHGLSAMAAKMDEQDRKDGKGWSKMITKHPATGAPIRVMSPNAGRVLHSGLFEGYYASYVDKVWEKYRNEDLVIDTQHGVWGSYRCRVENDGLLHCYSLKDGVQVGTFFRPEAKDVFSCSTGPFAPPYPGPGETEPIMLNLGARLAAALNRSTLLVNSTQPTGEKVETYYKADVTNHYARACHEVTVGGRGYAFPYDDVAPVGGPDQSGFIQEGEPVLFTVTIGG